MAGNIWGSMHSEYKTIIAKILFKNPNIIKLSVHAWKWKMTSNIFQAEKSHKIPVG